MLIHRLDRITVDKRPSPIDLNRQEYYQWCDKATDARDRYLAGELTLETAATLS